MFGHTDRLMKFEEDLLRQNPDLQDLPPRPSFGNLDVDDVKNSTFFFA
jgi:DNA-directed RNA polymerase